MLCYACEYPCATCYDNYPTKCYTCGYKSELRNAPSRYNKTCNCKTGYYEGDDGETGNKTCLKC